MAKNIDMTGGGSLSRKIILFALPLMASGVVQQSCNSVDVAVVGRFVGHHALAAVGANGPVIGLIVNLFIGVSVGANVVIATCLGQRNERDTARAVSTSMLIAAIGGIILTCIGLLVAGPMLRALDTPDAIVDDAASYLRIFSLGFMPMLLYNFGSAVLRSIGDTRRPFYWLVAGGLVNVVLNLLFVIVLKMGVHGVATATVISNIVSSSGIISVLIREHGPIRLDLRHLRVWGTQFKKIMQIGVPAGVQGMVFALSNVFIQSAINGFGTEAIAGSAAAINFEIYSYFILTAFVQACVAFMSQNYGAGLYSRCRKVYRRCMLMGAVGCGSVNLLIYFFHPSCIESFTTDPQAIACATERISTVLIWQWIATSYEVSGAALRSLGYSLTPTVFTILGTCVVRVGWVWAAHFTSFAELLRVYPITWMLTGVAVVIAWLWVARRRLNRPDPVLPPPPQPA